MMQGFADAMDKEAFDLICRLCHKQVSNSPTPTAGNGGPAAMQLLRDQVQSFADDVLRLPKTVESFKQAVVGAQLLHFEDRPSVYRQLASVASSVVTADGLGDTGPPLFLPSRLTELTTLYSMVGKISCRGLAPLGRSSTARDCLGPVARHPCRLD